MAAPIASSHGRGGAAPIHRDRTEAARCEGRGPRWPPGAGSGRQQDGRGGDPAHTLLGEVRLLRR